MKKAIAKTKTIENSGKTLKLSINLPILGFVDLWGDRIYWSNMSQNRTYKSNKVYTMITDQTL